MLSLTILKKYFIEVNSNLYSRYNDTMHPKKRDSITTYGRIYLRTLGLQCIFEALYEHCIKY